MEQRYNQTTDLFADEPVVVYAGFWERFGAAFIDGIIVGVAGAVLGMIFRTDAVRGEYFTTANVINLVIGWLYYAIQESSPAQATLGKKALGLKVTSTSGGRISFGQATGRHFGKFISAMILFIGYFMMLWSNKKQTLHDAMASTLVVKA